MTHPRVALRAAVRTALSGAAALAGVRVFKSWAQSIDSTDDPAIGVMTPTERSNPGTGNSTDRRTALVVMYRAEGGDSLDDDLDDISAVIEPLVLTELADFQLFGLENTEIDISGEGERRVGNLTLTFFAERYTLEGSPSPL